MLGYGTKSCGRPPFLGVGVEYGVSNLAELEHSERKLGMKVQTEV